MKITLPYAVVLFVLLVILTTVAPAQAAPTSPQGPLSITPPYGVIWGMMAFVNAGLARGRNHSGLIWFLVSLLIGPIATIILIVFFPKQPR